MADQENQVLDHSYDGIQEYDNPLPGWWNLIFVGSIAFSILYLLFYHANVPGRTVLDDYDRAVAANLRLQFGDLGELELNADTIAQFMHDDEWLKVGQIVFKANCVSCHGVDAQGVVGPNLTDDYWKNVRNLEDLGLVIRNGAAGQAMPAWKNRLHPTELVLVASYVASLRGTNAPGKGAEGPEIPPWPSPSEEPDEAATDENTTEDETPNDEPPAAEAATDAEPQPQGEPTES